MQMLTEMVHHWNSPKQARKAVALCWRLGYTPNLIGRSGCGKSTTSDDLYDAIVKQDKRAKKYRVYVSAMEAGDQAVPIVVKETIKDAEGNDVVLHEVKLAPMALIPFLTLRIRTEREQELKAWEKACEKARAEGKPEPRKPSAPNHVLQWEEIDRIKCQSILNCVQNIILDGSFNGLQLDENVRQIATMNGTLDDGTEDLSESLRGRMVHIPVGNHMPEWIESYAEYNAKAGLDPRMVAFNKANTFRKPELASIAVDQARTRDWASRFYTVGKSVGADDFTVRTCMYGCVGEALGEKLFQYLSALTKEQALVMSQQELAKIDPELLRQLLVQHEDLKQNKRFMSKLPPEVQARSAM